MKKILFFVFSFFLLVSCKQTNRHTEHIVSNRINRNDSIAFMGLRLGLPNDSVKTVLQSSENFIIKEFPDIYTRSGHNIFEDWDENVIGTFFCTIIDTNNESHGGWGKVESYVDNVTTIYYYIPTKNETDSIYERIKPLFVERYGEPDKEYETGRKFIKDEVVYNKDIESTLYDKGCYWDFANNQRIYLNSTVYWGMNNWDIFSVHMRVEIVYRDMKAVRSKEETKKKKKQKEQKERLDAEKKRIQNNMKRRKEQQL